MEAFKAVEKEMKTKAFSKEGLSASAKMDPHEQEKLGKIQFLSDVIEELSRQVEAVEAETEQIQAHTKKPKKDAAKAERLAELEHTSERHKWHLGRLELLLRAVENDGVSVDQIKGAEEDIKNYVDNNQEIDFYEDDGIYDEFNLDEEEDRYGVPHDQDKPDSPEDNSNEGDPLEQTVSSEGGGKQKSKSISESSTGPHRRLSQHVKSPLPTLATLHTSNSSTSNATPSTMKPAPPPAKPPGEILKYASAAASATANDKAGIGVAPLPAPQNAFASTPGSAPANPVNSGVRTSAAASPASHSAQPTTSSQTSDHKPAVIGTQSTDKQSAKSPIPSQSSIAASSPAVSSAQVGDASTRDETPPITNHTSEVPNKDSNVASEVATQTRDKDSLPSEREPRTNGAGPNGAAEADAVFHLPSSLQELVDSYQAIKEATLPVSAPDIQRQLDASYATRPDTFDLERPRHYRPKNPATFTPSHYPQEPLAVFDDPRLYDKIDTDSLFYSFYYRQGTYQQYLAAKALKNQSWRFHKQYQTWFQRLEEPKTITEDHEQGTYRFFDYESTWYGPNFSFRNGFTLWTWRDGTPRPHPDGWMVNRAEVIELFDRAPSPCKEAQT